MLIVLIGSAAGVAQIASRKQPTERDAPAIETSRQNPDIAQMQRERDEALRQVRELRAKAAEERAGTQHKDGKCIGGVLFATVEGELRNVGNCR